MCVCVCVCVCACICICMSTCTRHASLNARCACSCARARALRSMWSVAKKETARSRNFAFRAFRAPFRVFRDPKITRRGIRRGAE